MNNIKTFENFNNQDIFKYISNDDIENIKNYIKSGNNLNIKNKYNYTILMYASEYNNSEIVQLLLDNKVDIDYVGYDGNTALHIACRFGNTEIVRLLIDAGADFNKKDNHKKTHCHNLK